MMLVQKKGDKGESKGKWGRSEAFKLFQKIKIDIFSLRVF